jgi:heat shock protein HspQ
MFHYNSEDQFVSESDDQQVSQPVELTDDQLQILCESPSMRELVEDLINRLIYDDSVLYELLDMPFLLDMLDQNQLLIEDILTAAPFLCYENLEDNDPELFRHPVVQYLREHNVLDEIEDYEPAQPPSAQQLLQMLIQQLPVAASAA